MPKTFLKGCFLYFFFAYLIINNNDFSSTRCRFNHLRRGAIFVDDHCGAAVKVCWPFGQARRRVGAFFVRFAGVAIGVDVLTLPAEVLDVETLLVMAAM